MSASIIQVEIRRRVTKGAGGQLCVDAVVQMTGRADRSGLESCNFEGPTLLCGQMVFYPVIPHQKAFAVSPESIVFYRTVPEE